MTGRPPPVPATPFPIHYTFEYDLFPSTVLYFAATGLKQNMDEMTKRRKRMKFVVY
jgi:hypothetical protein